MKSSGHGYRPEIDGLRAVSILCVLFFHLGGQVFQGGYIGVDIFFVISGYLITRNIVDDLSAGKFSLALFYSRRIRRLFPALLFTVAVTFFAAVLWFPPDELHKVARDVIFTLISVANISFWRQTHQYFALNAMDVPLLHMWSLSVEEQFYLVWSAGLLAVAALWQQKIIPVLVFAAGIVSLAACQYWLSRDPVAAVAAFYLMPFRIFELSIGALCIWAERWLPPGRFLADLLFTLGLGAIGISAFAFSSATPFPGVNALLPCLGAAFVIFSGTRARLSVLLNNRLAVGIGLISYSLYLCHWPIFVFSHYIFGELKGFAAGALLLALSFAVAILMYFFIEKPFRFHYAPVTTESFFRLLARCAAISAPVLLLAVSASPLEGGWPWRLTAEQRELARLQSFANAPCPRIEGKCVFGDTKGPPGVEIIGDSHAGQLVAIFQPMLLAHGLSGQIYSAGACLMLAGVHSKNYGRWLIECEKAREESLASFGRATVPLVISQDWVAYGPGSMTDDEGHVLDTSAPEKRLQVYRTALEKTYEQFGGNKRQTLIVGPQVTHDCSINAFLLQPGPFAHATLRPCPPYPVEKVHATTREITEMLQEFQRAHPKTVSLLMPADFLCGSDCPIWKDGLWLYRDDAHLTVAGAEYFGERAHRVLDKFLTPDKAAIGQ